MENKRVKIQKMTRISIFASMIAASSVFSISIFVVPFTLQTLMIVLAAMILSPSEAFWAVITYLALGLIGLPVYSGLKSGLDVLVGPTGGFLLSFPIAAYLIARTKESNSFIKALILNIIIGIGFINVCGIGYFSWYTSVTLWSSTKTMLLFIPSDLIKIMIATFVGIQVRKRYIFST